MSFLRKQESGKCKSQIDSRFHGNYNFMNFNLNESIEILSRTPEVLRKLLSGLPDRWTMANEGGDSWSPFDILGHLIHGEETDWIPRTRVILSSGADREFEPYDRFAQFKKTKGKTLSGLLDEFAQLREKNIAELESFGLSDDKLMLEGIHPEFGRVTLKQMLATWVIHDLTHIAQISRVMAKQYKGEMGPWVKYFKLMGE
jgi:hypothetical protein